MSNEKVLKLRGRKAYWGPAPSDSGPIDPSRLPEGYPYKEQSETVLVEETAVEMAAIGSTGVCNGRYVTEVYLEVGAECAITINGETYKCTAKDQYGTIFMGNLFVYGKANGMSEADLTAAGFVNTGEPFTVVNTVDGDFSIVVEGSVESITFAVSQTTETIHPMSPEFLPAGVGGGGVLFEIAESDYTESSGTYMVTKSYDPIYEQLEKGGSVVIKLNTSSGVTYILPQMAQVMSGQGFVVIASGQSGNTTLAFSVGSYH